LLAATGLNTAFFVRGDNEFTRMERASLPDPIIQIEDAPGLGREIGIAWEDPTAMSPRTKRIGAEPTPQSRPADLRYQALGDHSAPNLRERKSRQRRLQAMRKFTSESLNLDDDAGGKTGGSPAPRLSLEAGKPREGKSLTPLADIILALPALLLSWMSWPCSLRTQSAAQNCARSPVLQLCASMAASTNVGTLPAAALR